LISLVPPLMFLQEMKNRMVLSMIVAVVQTSCILPIPHRRVHAEGIEGKVVAATSKMAISGAQVSSAITRNELATTDSGGDFRIKPDYGWHGAMLIGPISYSLLPYFDIQYPPPPIRISAVGFRSREFRDRKELAMKVFPLDAE
jgi:hypothetical protein